MRPMSDEARQACVLAFRRLRCDWPAGTELLLVEVHDGDSDLTWDLWAYPMDRRNTQVDGVAERVVEGLLVHGATDAREVAEWVASAWNLAGGDRLSLPAFVAPHDYWQSVDVRTGRWVEDSAIYVATPWLPLGAGRERLIGQSASVNFAGWMAATAGIAGFCTAAAAGQGSGWIRVVAALAVGLVAAMSALKLTTRESPVSDSGVEHLVWAMFAAIALFDGAMALVGGTGVADWTPAGWSLPLGLLIAAGELRDFGRWRQSNRDVAEAP